MFARASCDQHGFVTACVRKQAPRRPIFASGGLLLCLTSESWPVRHAPDAALESSSSAHVSWRPVATRILPTRLEYDVRQTRAVVTETRRAASAESRGPRGPIRRWTRARPADVIDLFVYVVVLNLAIEYTPSVISESFSLSLLTAALLKIALELVILLKTQIITRLRAADTRRAKLAAAGSLWVVAAGSKLVVLELVDLVFGDAVSLGGFISVTLLVVALLVSRAAVRRFLSDTATAA